MGFYSDLYRFLSKWSTDGYFVYEFDIFYWAFGANGDELVGFILKPAEHADVWMCLSNNIYLSHLKSS